MKLTITATVPKPTIGDFPGILRLANKHRHSPSLSELPTQHTNDDTTTTQLIHVTNQSTSHNGINQRSSASLDTARVTNHNHQSETPRQRSIPPRTRNDVQLEPQITQLAVHHSEPETTNAIVSPRRRPRNSTRKVIRIPTLNMERLRTLKNRLDRNQSSSSRTSTCSSSTAPSYRNAYSRGAYTERLESPPIITHSTPSDDTYSPPPELESPVHIHDTEPIGEHAVDPMIQQPSNKRIPRPTGCRSPERWQHFLTQRESVLVKYAHRLITRKPLAALMSSLPIAEELPKPTIGSLTVAPLNVPEPTPMPLMRPKPMMNAMAVSMANEMDEIVSRNDTVHHSGAQTFRESTKTTRKRHLPQTIGSNTTQKTTAASTPRSKPPRANNKIVSPNNKTPRRVRERTPITVLSARNYNCAPLQQPLPPPEPESEPQSLSEPRNVTTELLFANVDQPASAAAVVFQSTESLQSPFRSPVRVRTKRTGRRQSNGRPPAVVSPQRTIQKAATNDSGDSFGLAVNSLPLPITSPPQQSSPRRPIVVQHSPKRQQTQQRTPNEKAEIATVPNRHSPQSPPMPVNINRTPTPPPNVINSVQSPVEITTKFATEPPSLTPEPTLITHVPEPSPPPPLPSVGEEIEEDTEHEWQNGAIDTGRRHRFGDQCDDSFETDISQSLASQSQRTAIQSKLRGSNRRRYRNAAGFESFGEYVASIQSQSGAGHQSEASNADTNVYNE